MFLFSSLLLVFPLQLNKTCTLQTTISSFKTQLNYFFHAEFLPEFSVKHCLAPLRRLHYDLPKKSTSKYFKNCSRRLFITRDIFSLWLKLNYSRRSSKYLAVVGVSCCCGQPSSGCRGNNAGQISEKWHSYSQFAYECFDSPLIRNR